jgi:O-antigen ligase
MGGSESASLVNGTSSTSRQLKYIESANIFSENPFGIGFGNYARYAPSADHQADYPHNFFVEMCVEEGAITAFVCIVFIAFLFSRIIRSGRQVRDPLYLFLMLITIYTFMNGLVSGDLGDLRFFLTYSLLLLTVFQINRSAATQNSLNTSQQFSGLTPTY